MGLKQGDALSSVLFNFFVEYLGIGRRRGSQASAHLSGILEKNKK
jgi:hypothetical protein